MYILSRSFFPLVLAAPLLFLLLHHTHLTPLLAPVHGCCVSRDRGPNIDFHEPGVKRPLSRGAPEGSLPEVEKKGRPPRSNRGRNAERLNDGIKFTLPFSTRQPIVCKLPS